MIPVEEREKALAALGRLSARRADDRDMWLKVGMALHSVSPDLETTWDSWSQQSEKFKPGECARQWRSFKPNGGVTLGTLLAWAKADSGEMPAPKPRPRRPAPTEKPKTVYPTLDAAIEAMAHVGKFAWKRAYPGPHNFHVARFDLASIDPETGKCRKIFLPFHETRDGWVVGDPPGKLPLYRGDDLPADGPIVVTEGELTADAARSIGLVAVTSSHGSKSAARSDWTPLRGREIIILRDNDPDGLRYAKDVAAILVALGCEVRIVLLPDLPPKGDIADWLSADGEMDGKTAEECHAAILGLAEQTPIYSPPPADTAAAAVVPAFLTVAEILQAYPVQREAVIEGLIRRGEVGNLISGPKLYKSWLLMQLALCIATARDFLGFPTKLGRVLILDFELHAATLAKRMYLMLTATGITADEIGDRLVIEPLRGRRLDVHALGDYFNVIPARRFDCVIIDPLYRLFPDDMDENSNANFAALYATLQRHAENLDSALVVVHHLSKGDQSFKSVTDLGSGGGSQSRAADAHLAIRPHAQEGVGVLSGVLRSFPPFNAFCIRREFPLWVEARDLDPADLRRPQPRRSKAAAPPTEPPPPAWTVERFAAEILTDAPQTRAAVLDVATRAGVPNVHQATRLLELAEATDKAFRWRLPKDKRTYFAAQPQPTLTGGTP